MKAALIIAVSLIVSTLAPHPVIAQDGCQTAQISCSQMNATCESRCKNSNNPSACIARSCSGTLATCKANGVWKSPGSAGCWKTNNRA